MKTSYSMTKGGDGVVVRGSVVIGGVQWKGEEKIVTIIWFTVFIAFI